QDVAALFSEVRTSPEGILAIALESSGELVTEIVDAESEEEPDKQMLLAATAAEPVAPLQLRLAISAKASTALSLTLDDSPAARLVKQALADPAIPKAIHDSKAATHALNDRGIELRGVLHDPLLYSYLLDPTYSKYSLADLAFRTFSLKMSDNLSEA